ncbi:putative disease resistance RPP13-like protein 1 [Macadamia integrifolia]|uniref:putative disease resistance RPP13-like protein 1 n=1 Tax=Macadamia integrifolia TaxID=60698 RepID=UPI001C52937D|nr:putative disease resistance RPP13-like protein 1 [Macadamia integrifolia]XP_042481543.1 putative disease resistance RPP13-like protein 1 [Macadamia integrifolia]XP_042481544.1 putative disease resistance RPP13-like protein 1 [Macadamia integrifolia]XP_042481545.1 putative disease resistance RPP13-like protein 1 [Macadamia integrifolia]XP_042481546.1 putative disease resistance RPP13-like protein 1 [Macadamia integrifolia]XP_042481547.1 putative disease resistance RPP13-like protein 1 [Macad
MSGVEQRFRGPSFLQGALDRFSSPELRDFIRRWKINLEEVESLKRTSARIHYVSDEAEVKQFTNDAVKLWLNHLKQLFYDAEDILDDYATEILRLKLESNSHHQTQQQSDGTESADKDINETSEGIDQPKVFNMAEELQGIKRFGSKVRDIHEKLKSVEQEGAALGLMNSSIGSGSSRSSSERPQTSSLVNSTNVFGRDEDKWEIVKWLLSDKTPSPNDYDNSFSVLPIVGMGGLGKTTLAQLVYNDEKVDKYFQLKAWVCISEDFDVMRLTKEIHDSATKSSSPPSDSLDVLQVKLKEVLSNKRFLLVLDDMWNEDYEKWDALKTPFAFGKLGSKILITTRNKGIASMVRTTENDHHLKGLSNEACFELIRRHAFKEGDSTEANQKMTVFGEEIVKKCKSLPLAIKTLASLLKDKKENSEWKDILENEIWDLKENKILPSLMLSYHHLSPILKRCFTYCALFPKDYVFNKIELVILWMAEGIVQPIPKGKKRVEDIGAAYFDELFMRSFLELSYRPPYNITSHILSNSIYVIDKEFHELSKAFHIRSFFETSSNTGSEFVMHDLIHDLAEFVSDGIYCRSEEYDKTSEVVTTTTRHLSYLVEYCNVEATELEAMNLRTLLELKVHYVGSPNQFLPTMQFQFLRVLRLRKYGKFELPDSIGKLKHLRLLDLSNSMVTKLPNSIASLYNLQTLILIGCVLLREYPEEMDNLINLRHLFLPVWSLEEDSYEMALRVDNFTSLQTLSTFIVGSKKIGSELRWPQQLHGSLDISNLENVGYENETKAIVNNLKNNTHLLGLRLRWSAYKDKDNFSDLGRDEKVEEDVLEQLQPPTNLEALWIQNYGGTRFPSWIEHSSFSNLETVSLINCRKCRSLPYLGTLPLLKHLVIYGCNAIIIVGSELCGNGSSSSTNKQFRSLETLFIEGIEEWEEWIEVVEEEEEGGGQFPCLRKLSIRGCHKLKMFSQRLPILVELEIRYCNDLSELPQFLPSLRRLTIFRCPKLVVVPSLPSSIESLYLSKCDLITTLPESDRPSSSAPCVNNSFSCLQGLEITNCPALVTFPQTMFSTTLQKLKIIDCKNLESLPTPGLLHNFTSLHSLALCNINFLPDGLHKLTSLHELEITSSPALVTFPDIRLFTALRELRIRDCKNLESLAMGVSDGLLKLTSLYYVEIEECPALEFFPDMGLPTSLLYLSIQKCGKLKFSPKELHKLTELRGLRIVECSSLMDCTNQEPLLYCLFHNLTTLRSLTIGGCPDLVSIPKSMFPTNLRDLAIMDCPILESVHNGLSDVTSLERLRIHNCPILAQRCRDKEGEEWSKLSQFKIFRILIDEERVLTWVSANTLGRNA